MRIVRLCLICLLMALAAPLCWGRMAMPEPAAAMAMTDEAPCPLHQAAHPAAHLATHQLAHQPAPTATAAAHGVAKPPAAHHLPCGDCSACHVVALLPARLQLHSPEPAHTAPLWTPSLADGRMKGCELYRPPQA